jgi:hypothetical protein
MKPVELTSIALELDASDPRIVVLQPIVRVPNTSQLSTSPHQIRKREWQRRRRAELRAARRSA